MAAFKKKGKRKRGSSRQGKGVQYINPWAVCNKQLGPGRSRGEMEACTQGVKRSARRYGKRITSKAVGKGGRLLNK